MILIRQFALEYSYTLLTNPTDAVCSIAFMFGRKICHDVVDHIMEWNIVSQ